jgi:oligosaccharide repeat unit polymerase
MTYMTYKEKKSDSKASLIIFAQFVNLLVAVLFTMLDSNQLKALSFYSLFSTIAIMLFLIYIVKKTFTITTMFMLFLALFHFGQAWLYAFGGKVDTNIAYDNFSLYSQEEIHNILLFGLITYNLIAFFMICYLRKNSVLPTDDNKKSKFDYDRKIVFTFGILFLLVLIVPVMIYDYLLISISTAYGHFGLYEYSDQLSVWAAANSYFPFAILMVMLGSDPSKKNWKLIYYYAIVRCILLMLLTGKRGSFVIPLILYIYCKHNFIDKYKRRHLVIGAAGLFLMLTLISFVAYGRGDYSNMNFTDFILEKNIIVQILSEFGSTFTTTILAYRYALSKGLLNGKSYLGALSVFLPFSDMLTPGLKSYMSVSALLNPNSPSGGALGGSLLGEMYINFGYFALCLTPLIAWMVGIVEKTLQNSSKYSLFSICCSVYISYGFWIWVRGNLVDVVFITKRVLYVWILYCIYILIIKRKTVNETETINRL